MESWKNRAVNENFEPGSILKVVTAAAAMEENLVNDSSRFYCRGSLKVSGANIRCWKSQGHGEQTFAQILQNSCNVGFMQLGEKIGKETLYKYYNAFGLGKRTNIDFPGEEKGILLPLNRVGPVELATEAFGQGIAVTAIQYMAAFGAIANDGKMIEPHLVKRITYTDEDGNTSVVKEVVPKVVKQVVSVETATKLRSILESVVTVGAGKKAYIEGYHVGGKTGTAQLVENRVYAAGKYISTFVAMAPCNDPKFIIMVSIKEPDPTNYYSGSTAGPIVKTIMEDIFRYLDVQPDLNDIKNPKVVREVIIPEVRGMTSADAQNVLKNNKINVDIQGTGNIVYDISPKPGISVKENTKIELYLGVETSNDNKIAVPDFSGMTKKEILDIADSLGLNISFMGDGIGSTQDINEGTEVKKKTTVRIILEAPED
jgi:stage V sporulation protein D (sporulation-specific penicillin-binding protein)